MDGAKASKNKAVMQVESFMMRTREVCPRLLVKEKKKMDLCVEVPSYTVCIKLERKFGVKKERGVKSKCELKTAFNRTVRMYSWVLELT
jgi:hypothetical protein